MEFLIFTSQAGEDGIEVRVEDENVWLTQKLIAKLFEVQMTMNDWAQKLQAFLKFNEKEILQNVGKVTAEIAKSFAESEFEKYRPIQDKLFESDFDREVKRLEKEMKKEKRK